MASGQDSCTISVLSSRNSRTSCRRPYLESVTKRQINAIINAVNKTEGFYDILSAINKLKKNSSAPDMDRHLLKKVSTKETLFCFIEHLLSFIPFTHLTDILNYIGFKPLAIGIKKQIKGEACIEIGHAELTASTFLQCYFYKIKSYLDDNIFRDRKEYLKKKFDNLSLELRNSEGRDTERAVAKISIVTWLRVQQEEKSNEIKALISEMKTKIPNRADKTLPRIVCLSKEAVACEMNGDSDIAETRRFEAFALSEVYSDPVIKALLFHDRRYIYQLRSMRLKDDDSRRKVELTCNEAIAFFSSSSVQNDFSTFIRRIFFLYLLHNFLHIGQNFEVNDSEAASPDEMAQANVIFSCLERSFQSGLPLEDRRKMIYFILRARMHEMGGGADFAVSYLEQAFALKDDGTYFRIEEEHLIHFKLRLLPIPTLFDN